MARSIGSIRARITETQQAIRELQRLEALLVQQGEETHAKDMMSAAYHLGAARVRALVACERWEADIRYLTAFMQSDELEAPSLDATGGSSIMADTIIVFLFVCIVVAFVLWVLTRAVQA